MGRAAAAAVRPRARRPGHGAGARGGGGWGAPTVGLRAGAGLGCLRCGARLGKARAGARHPPPAARRRARPHARGAVPSAPRGAREFRRRVAFERGGARGRLARHAPQGTRRARRGGTCAVTLSAEEAAALLPVPAAVSPAPGLQLTLVPAAAAGEPCAQLWAGLHLPGIASAAQLTQLAQHAQRFTPRVSLEPPDALLLEVRGS